MAGREWPEEPTLSFLAYMSLRRDRLGCSTPPICPDSPSENEHGPSCLVSILDNMVADSISGELLRRAMVKEEQAAMGLKVGLDDIDMEEYEALRVLHRERRRWDAELEREEAAKGKQV